ncbi:MULTISPECIES: hypothetical protein [unclassified Clostridium]|uniref:hypothetical protein n=1 Tax=unclassified Clostridium TaxID=2614128 RepID=UPI002A75C0AE|nr:hypothetical protein [Clostridium sp.]MCI6691171.1 hypothetical protein [Clostridium sp.]MDY2631594.1 hypothetical protein [Clostridium sp.]MDY4251200.1 hypothetical protein [Clostridium sp.]
MYIAFGRKVVDTDEMKNEIEKNSEFKVLKDMSKGTKREDTFAYNLSISIDILNEIISDDYDIKDLSEDELFDEYMSLSEELATDMEELLPADSIIDVKAYKWDLSDNDIRVIIAGVNEEVGEGKLKDVMRRLITQLE